MHSHASAEATDKLRWLSPLPLAFSLQTSNFSVASPLCLKTSRHCEFSTPEGAYVRKEQKAHFFCRKMRCSLGGGTTQNLPLLMTRPPSQSCAQYIDKMQELNPDPYFLFLNITACRLFAVVKFIKEHEE